MTDCRALLSEVAAVLRSVHDIVDERVQDDAVPSWVEARGWAPALLAMDDEQVTQSEAHGFGAVADGLPSAPMDLVALASRVRALSGAVPVLEQPPPAGPVPKASPRKRSQMAALAHACEPLLQGCRRLVDVGSGSGALSTELGMRFGKPVVGVELVAGRVNSARRRVRDPGVRFEQRDAVAEGLGLAAGDLAVGLHACGELGDALIRQAADSRASVLLVTCCVQKIRGDARLPLSAAAGNLALRRDVLGLANLSAREHGVELPTSQNMAARQARCAVRLLLRSRGLPTRPGEEMRGINRRTPLRSFDAFAEAALRNRGLPPPSAGELAEAQQAASEVFARVRRLSLPRSMLGPLVELFVVMDRACALQERGYQVRVARLFDAGISPRNLAIIARTEPRA